MVANNYWVTFAAGWLVNFQRIRLGKRVHWQLILNMATWRAQDMASAHHLSTPVNC